MRSLSLVLALLFALPATGAFAHDHAGKRSILHTSCCDWPTRWAARHDGRDARLEITTRDGDVTLFLTGDVVALQLSDRVMHKIERKLRDARDDDDDEDNALGATIKTAVLSSVRALLDHSAECPIRELRDVDYRDGDLVFITEDGDRIFEDIAVHDGEDVLGAFEPGDARRFSREFRRMKLRMR